jgi:AcrR family transcriptional regulator
VKPDHELPPENPLSLPIAGQRPERADAAANRRRILDAARRVLAERGADGTSIDAVTAEAGVGKGTLFRRFGDRAGLFQALLDDSLRSFQDEFIHGPPPLGPGAPAGQRLTSFFDHALELFDAQLELLLALERDRRGPPIGGYLAMSVHVESLVTEIDPELDASITAQLLLNAANPSVLRYLRRDAGIELARIQATMRRLIEGLSSPS